MIYVIIYLLIGVIILPVNRITMWKAVIATWLWPIFLIIHSIERVYRDKVSKRKRRIRGSLRVSGREFDGTPTMGPRQIDEACPRSLS